MALDQGTRDDITGIIGSDDVVLFMKGKRYYAQAGAGIVADSDPAFEYKETLDKVRAIIKAVSIAEEGF